MLPFLKDTKWPTSKEPEERVVNPSYDTKIEDQLVDELLIAMESRNASEVRESLMALIQHLKSEDQDAV